MPTSLGLFEDQVGKFDWLIENFGQVTWSKFVTVNSQSRALVASEHALALLDPKSGKIIWRKVFGEVDGRISKVELAENGDIYVVHEKRRILRLFDKSSGSLREEISFQSSAGFDFPIDAYAVVLKPSVGLLVATRAEIESFRSDENAVWSYPLKIEDYTGRKILLPHRSGSPQGSVGVPQGNVAVLTLYPSKVNVLFLDSETGEKEDETVLQIPESFQKCKFEGVHVFCWKDDALTYLPLFEKSTGEAKHESKLKFPVFDVTSIGDTLHLITFADSDASLVRITENGAIENVAFFSDYQTHSEISTSYSKPSPIIGIINNESSDLTITAFDVKSFDKVFTQKITSQNLKSHGKVTTAAFLSGKNSERLDRVLFSFEDYNLAMVGISTKNEVSVLWEKDQSLAHVINVDMCDLNLSETMITLEADFEFAGRAKTTISEMFYRRFSSHFSQFMSFATDAYEKISKGTFLTGTVP